MATSTTFLGLEKPATPEKYDVSLLNRNSDRIDNFAKGLGTKIDWTPVTLISPWKNVGSGWAGLKIIKIGDEVTLRGVINGSGGASNTYNFIKIAVLDAPYRPVMTTPGESAFGFPATGRKTNVYSQAAIAIYANGDLYYSSDQVIGTTVTEQLFVNCNWNVNQ